MPVEDLKNIFVHSYTDGDGCHAHQEQFGVQYLAQGHFDMKTRGSYQYYKMWVAVAPGQSQLLVIGRVLV